MQYDRGIFYICTIMTKNIIHHFTNDYSEGCHPLILEALTNSNMEQLAGYGDDTHSATAADLIKNKIGNPNAQIHFIGGGTQANLVVLASILKPFESIISVESGHINTHEAGAIEATGHKIEYIASDNGKLTPDIILPLLNKFPEYHTVKPRVVYISNSTEIGTIYSKDELTRLYTFCKDNSLLLFMDGARIASALTAASNDLTLADIASLTDVFYIGGTKCGALLGEAIVFPNTEIGYDFRYHLKQRGAMLAKGRVLGIQFEQLLKDDLFLSLARHANKMAQKMNQAIKELGYSFLTESDTNQIFPILPNTLIDQLKSKYEFIIWQSVNPDESAIRLVTSWATPEKAIDIFIKDLYKTAQ